MNKNFDRVLVGGRWTNTNNDDSLPIIKWSEHHGRLGSCVVAVDPGFDKSHCWETLAEQGIATTLLVQPWFNHQKWTAPLNALVAEAALQNKEFVLFSSTGARVAQEALDAMVEIMDAHPEVAFVGPLTDQHYFFEVGIQQLSGISIPWNNTGLWRVTELVKVGFQLVSDGLVDPNLHGVEEVVTLAILHLLRPETKAILVKDLPGDYVWEQEKALGQEYIDWTDKKIRSKNERPAGQLKSLGLSAPSMVIHLDWNEHAKSGELPE